ncbi:CLUMA_CG010147, isoform A [Clunio marinus]|uniref:CLUMA_CG010147, isoform A n=1 Tax=Clunio marinus TaxID=568069 RepID=A0A1J1IAF2_9DIPT|nr:CLUMA_CG010147, isoform A [Clunio marinus]
MSKDSLNFSSSSTNLDIDAYNCPTKVSIKCLLKKNKDAFSIVIAEMIFVGEILPLSRHKIMMED